MIGKLRDILGPGGSSPSRGTRRRVSLQRRFTIISETARGSMSKVYRALDNETGRTVCLEGAVAREKRSGLEPGIAESAASARR